MEVNRKGGVKDVREQESVGFEVIWTKECACAHAQRARIPETCLETASEMQSQKLLRSLHSQGPSGTK